jgi:hypothetical protein
MSMSWKRANDTLTAALGGGATPHILLHTGDPGPNAASNVAQYDSSPIARKAIAFGDGPEAHPSNTEQRALNTAGAEPAVEWTGSQIDAAQEITHFSIWSASTAGQVEFIAAVATPKTTGSDGVRIGIGDIEVAIGVFAKEPA